VPIVAIVNPASGPGGSQDSNYVSGINELRDAGVMVLGYVSTAYTSRSLTAVRGDIDRWDSWYNVDGIFFDEQTNTAGGETYYTQAGDYAESKGLDFTVGNPGANSRTSYLSTVDVVLIYESPGLPNLSNYASWESADNNKLGMIPFSVSSLPTSWLEDATAFIGWVYVTNDSLPNPWDSLPAYFDDMAALLDDGSSLPPGGTPDPEHKLTVTSVDQAGKAISGMWMDVKRDGATVSTGFSPLSLTMDEGTYTVSTGNYQNIVFDHWNDGSKSSTTTVNLNADKQITAYYNNGAQTPPPPPQDSTLTVRTVDSSGAVITGYYTTLSQNGAVISTGFSPASFTLKSGQAYQVSVSDYGNYAFDHWNDGSTSRQKTVTGGQTTSLTAYYRNGQQLPQTSQMTVKSTDLTGKDLTGMWTTVTTGGAAVKSGYTPLTFTAQRGTTYEVSVSNYQNNVFDHWSDGNTRSTRQVTASSDATLTAMYSTGPREATLSVSSVNLSGSAFTGMWTVVSQDGTTLQTGFTPVSFKGKVGAQYVVSVGDYQNNVFDHWEDGSKSRTKTIVIPADGLALKAYYRR
jgi:hypothetical protein